MTTRPAGSPKRLQLSANNCMPRASSLGRVSSTHPQPPMTCLWSPPLALTRDGPMSRGHSRKGQVRSDLPAAEAIVHVVAPALDLVIVDSAPRGLVVRGVASVASPGDRDKSEHHDDRADDPDHDALQT